MSATAEAAIEHALTHSPFQRARLRRLGIGDPTALGDLPPLTRQELIDDQRAAPPFGTNLTEPLERYVRVHETGGRSGTPLRVLHTRADSEWWSAGLARAYRAAGIGPGDRVALLIGPHAQQAWAADAGLSECGALAIALGDLSDRQRLRTIGALEATALVCTPSRALGLIGHEDRPSSLERVLCTGEPGASRPALRARIERALGVRCLDHAGLAEAGPYGYPCPEGGGLHVDEDAYVCELLDDDLQPTPVGVRGELVLTPLGRRGFPVLRYRTGDVAVNVAERCPAGHPHRWLPDGIVGRADAAVAIRGRTVYPSLIEEAVLGAAGVGQFRVSFASAPGGDDEATLEVELTDGAAVRELQERLGLQLGLRVRTVPIAPGSLPRGEGQRVVDLRASRWPA